MSYVLLVEDNQQNADMMIHLLTSVGYEVKHCERGLDGARQARTERPALILMDFNLPDIDGRNLILSLRHQLGGQAAPPIVAVTARVSEVDMKLAQRFGCAAFIAKPFTPEKFLEVVQHLAPIAESGAASAAAPSKESQDATEPSRGSALSNHQVAS